MGTHDAADDEKAESVAVGFCSEVGLEDSRDILGRDAATSIGKNDLHIFGVLRSFDMKDAAGFHGLKSVPANVVERLFELIAVELQQRQGVAQALFQKDVSLLDFSSEKLQSLIDHSIDVRSLKFEGLRTDCAKELSDDVVEASNFAAGDIHGFIQSSSCLWREFP